MSYFLRKSASNPTSDQDNIKITISFLDAKISKEDLRKKFKSCGEIKKINLNKISNTINTAEVYFANKNSIDKAYSINNSKINDCTLRIQKTTPPTFNKKFNSNSNSTQAMNIINPTSNSASESDSDSNSEEYTQFMSDYKKHFKTTHRIERKRMIANIDGDVNISDLLSQANNLYINNQYDEAISVLHEIITCSPDLREPYHILSMIYEERADIPKALSFLMLAAQLSHGESELWIRCANLSKQIRNLQQAEYCLGRAIKIEKNNQYLLYERASIQEELGNFRKAAGIYEKLLKLSPNAEILLHISNLYEKLNLIEKSMSIIENNYEKNSRKFLVLIRLFDLFLKYEKYAQGYYMFDILKNKNETLNLRNNCHIKIRFLFCCLELSQLKLSSNCNSKGKRSINDLIMMEEVLPDTVTITEHEIIIPEDLPENSNIIDNIITEFQKLCTDVEMENNLELLYKLFDILHKANDVDKFVFMYEKLEENIRANNNVDNLFSIDYSKNNTNENFHQLTPEIYSKIGEHYLKAKNYQKAENFFMKCLKNSSKWSSDNILIRFKLSEIYKVLGDYNSALEVLNSEDFIKSEIKGSGSVKKQNENENENIITNRLNKIKEEGYFAELEKNPFCLEEEISKDFLQNHLDNCNDDEDNEENENFNKSNIIQNLYHYDNNDDNEDEDNYSIQDKQIKIKSHLFNKFEQPLPLRHSREISKSRKSSFNFSEYNNIIDQRLIKDKKYLGNKRIRFKSNLSSHNSIENYNFETYLRRRNSVKSTDSNNTQSIIKTLNSLKLEYDELSEEINSCKQYYLKLQESLIYLQQNDIKKFLHNTYNALREVLINELKIEDLKAGLFYHIVQKSSMKNYFKINENVFDKFRYNNNNNNTASNNSTDQIDLIEEENDYDEEDNNNSILNKERESLFVRKTECNRAAARKKVRKTMALVDKQINELQNIDKYITKENFTKIIVSFIENSYKEKSYKESISILQLLLNSENFKQRNDYVLFNMHLFSIMNNIKLNNYKIAFVLLKRLMVQFGLKDFSVFWIFLSKISSHMNISHLRSFYYKLTYSLEMSGNIYLNSLLGITYNQTGNYNLSLRHLDLVQGTTLNNDPMYYFQYGLTYLLKSLSRNNKLKESSLLKANDYFNFYALKKNKTNPMEVLFNMGRMYQFIGHDKMAKEKYVELMSKVFMKADKLMEKEKLYRSTVYNYSLLLRKNGNDQEAHRLIMENIIIK